MPSKDTDIKAIQPPTHFLKCFLNQLKSYLLGLLGIGFIGLVFGFTFNERLVSMQDQYFGSLQDMLSLILFMPLATLIFGAIALFRKDFTYLFYPIFAFFIAGELVDTSFIHLIVGYTPILEPQNIPLYLESLVAVTLSYFLLHAYAWPIKQIVKNSIKQTSDFRNIMISSLFFLLVLTTASTFIIQNAKTWLISQQRTCLAVKIPDNQELLGRPESDYTILQKYNDSYVLLGDVMTRPLEKWWEKDVNSVCGKQTTTTIRPGQIAINKFSNTKNGERYAESIFSANSSSSGLPSTAYKEYRYCFVAGNKHYILIRSNRTNVNYLEQYPAGDIIDTIVKSSDYMTVCAKKLEYYCKPSDQEKLQTLDKEFRSRQAKAISTNTPSGVTLNTAEKSAYKELGRINMSKWNVSFPISEEIKDAYLVPKGGDFSIKLRSLDKDKCFANGGVATLSRKLISEIKTAPGISIEGKIVGDYVYSLVGFANLSFCSKNAGFDSDRANKITDVFDWSESNIR